MYKLSTCKIKKNIMCGHIRWWMHCMIIQRIMSFSHNYVISSVRFPMPSASCKQLVLGLRQSNFECFWPLDVALGPTHVQQVATTPCSLCIACFAVNAGEYNFCFRADFCVFARIFADCATQIFVEIIFSSGDFIYSSGNYIYSSGLF